MKKVALIDWDGTVRKDFTIRSWIRFLVRHDVFDSNSIREIEAVFALLGANRISHDEASYRTTAIYALYLEGHRQREITKLASLFVEEDAQHLCAFSSALLSLLTGRGIEVVVVSGAPIEILREYRPIIPITTFHALELRAVNGKFLSEVLTNYGTAYAKYSIVNHFRKSDLYKIVFAAGNSSSDLPLLNAAPAGIIVNNPSLVIQSKCLHVSCEECDLERILSFLENEVTALF